METKVITVNGVLDLSNIKNQEDLKAEIAFLKESIKKEEEELGNHFRRFPQHAVKSAADNLFKIYTRYRQLGGDIITIGSDAHVAENIGSNLKLAKEMSDAIGLRAVYFKSRKPEYMF